MINVIHLSEAKRIFKRSRHVKKYGFKRYPGSVEQVCLSIIKDCWNGRYFQVSSGHFCEFYIRDFGWCVDSLVYLGYEEECYKTLDYALGIYSKQGVKTTITPKGKAVDIFSYSVDSLPFLVRSIKVLKAYDLLDKYKGLFLREIGKCFKLCFDKGSSLVRKDKFFSSIKDEAKRKSCCYDNVMLAMLSDDLDDLGLDNPFNKYDIKKSIYENFWNKRYFYEDLSKKDVVTGDSNIFPFFCKIFDDKDMIRSCIEEIQKSGLDKPFPLKYSSSRIKGSKFNLVSFFVDGYEHDSVWMHMGPLFVDMVRKVDKDMTRKYLGIYRDIIDKRKNFLEVFDKHGKPFKSWFYHTDEGMLWAANLLRMLNEA